MICPTCQTEQSEGIFCGACGATLSGRPPTANERAVITAHAEHELARNTKGLAGFGCLTLYFGMGALTGLSMFLQVMFPPLRGPRGSPASLGEEVKGFFGALLFTLFFVALAYFPARALMKRWQRRRHYAALISNPPASFPSRAPGLSEKQYRAEIARLDAVHQNLQLARKVSGEIETATSTS